MQQNLFVYFDLGNVLLPIDHERACRQMAAVATADGYPLDAAAVREVVFTSGMELEYEAGKLSTDDFYRYFCERTNTRPNQARLLEAASDIFQTNNAIKPVIGGLIAARYRLGVLSNTNAAHWDFVCRRHSWIPFVFSVRALSFQIGAVKPDLAIFVRAAELARVTPQEIFYVDDIAGHVEAARRVGFDAVQYTSVPALVAELSRRGVRVNY